jgi:DNA-binding beta-propeller fold protein YncE
MRLALLPLLFALAGCGNNPEVPDLVWGKRGLQPGDFIRPRALTTNGGDELYTVDFAGRIQVFTLEGKLLRHWKTPKIDNGRPAGMAWSKKRNALLVADSHYQQILVYSPTGELLETIPGTRGPGNLGPFQYVADLVEDTDGNLYVSEFGNENEDRIRKLNPNGEHLAHWGSHGTRDGEFSRPRGLAINSKNELVVADASNHRLQVFSLEGKHLRTIAGFNYPYDVAFNSRGEMYVAEWGSNAIRKVTADGQLVGTWGKAGREPGCLHQPWGVAVARNNAVFILDSDNHRIQRVNW